MSDTQFLGSDLKCMGLIKSAEQKNTEILFAELILLSLLPT